MASAAVVGSEHVSIPSSSSIPYSESNDEISPAAEFPEAGSEFGMLDPSGTAEPGSSNSSFQRSLYSLKETTLDIDSHVADVSFDPSLQADEKRDSETEERFVTVSKETVQVWDIKFFEEWDVDMLLHTEDGGQVAAQSKVLAHHSWVFDEMITVQQLRNLSPPWHITVKGVPYDALRAFVRFLYSSQYEEEDMKKYVLHFLALSHAYSIPPLKHVCTKELQNGLLNIENCTDALQVARMCHAPILSAICEDFIVVNFKDVSSTQGWKVLKDHNPQLEKELFEASVEHHATRSAKEKKTEEDRIYGQLYSAIKALHHICNGGCRSLKSQTESNQTSSPLPASASSSSSSSTSMCKFPGCKGIQLLVRHFANCQIKVSGGCLNCKRVWQLLELHSRVCYEIGDICRVPLCNHFKEKKASYRSQDEDKWNTVAKKLMNSVGSSDEKPFNGHLDFPI